MGQAARFTGQTEAVRNRADVSTRVGAWAAELGAVVRDRSSTAGFWPPLLILSAGFPVAVVAMLISGDISSGRLVGTAALALCVLVVILRLDYRVRHRTKAMFHVTSVRNRASILANGLDWKLMHGARGIAGSYSPEQEGCFLCHTDFEAKHRVRDLPPREMANKGPT
jgi:hypothetical protein